MIDQTTFDVVADGLLSSGIRVTYGNLRDAFRERNRAGNSADDATSHSMRDIQDPFADWKRRRRYKPHLAASDLPEIAEKAVATALDALRKAANTLPPGTPPMVHVRDPDEVMARIDEMSGSIARRLDALAAENANLRREVATLAAACHQQGPRLVRKGRKAGVFDSTSRHFWNRLMLMFRDHIKAEGPKPWPDLLALIDEDCHALAAAAFEPIDENKLKEKLGIRVGAKNYFRLEDGLYHVLPPEPRKRRPKPKAELKTPRQPKRVSPIMGNE